MHIFWDDTDMKIYIILIFDVMFTSYKILGL